MDRWGQTSRQTVFLSWAWDPRGATCSTPMAEGEEQGGGDTHRDGESPCCAIPLPSFSFMMWLPTLEKEKETIWLYICLHSMWCMDAKSFFNFKSSSFFCLPNFSFRQIDLSLRCEMQRRGKRGRSGEKEWRKPGEGKVTHVSGQSHAGGNPLKFACSKIGER